MAEDISSSGPVHPAVVGALAPGTPIHDKMHFGLAGEESILQSLRDSKRNTAIVVGLETDVCVCQSALGLLERDYRVAVVADAVGSPGPDHAYGLQRMRAAGVVVVGLKGLFYEWMRTAASSSTRSATKRCRFRPQYDCDHSRLWAASPGRWLSC
jgi:isochorismate hydrolase